MYVLDTDTLSLLFAAHPRVLTRRNNVPSSEIAISIVTRIEVLQGRFDFVLKAATGEELLRAQLWLDKTIQDLGRVEIVIPVDPATATEFDRLRQHKKLKKIGRGDLLIAAITLANRATLVTRNVKDFRQMPGLQIENWAD
ncbi:MAG TPA: type II toxin-antitoxin system VapC family toxin [Gemmataceae bacterium]|nr:type II toxin-antitoxin system VapC family toxin [Gemmataceae bacterium]